MAQDTTYNGWPNRQTWNIMLWMDNEESAYRFYVERVRSYKSAGKHFGGIAAKAVCRGALGDHTPDGVSLNSNLVKWSAIAEAMRESAE